MSQKEKKRMTGLRLAGEIRQYKKDALLSPLFTILCVILEILIPYKTAMTSICAPMTATRRMSPTAMPSSMMAAVL